MLSRGRASRFPGVGLGLALCVCAASVATAQTRAGEPDREHWQRIVDLIAAMGIHTGDAVADVGAGDGFVTVRLSPLVGSTGKVFAVDVAEAPLEGLRKRVQEAAIVNVTIIKGDDNDPHLPQSTLDSVLFLNAYHEMASDFTKIPIGGGGYSLIVARRQ